jgi:acetyl-CoA carboxylase carboxyltransferase component
MNTIEKSTPATTGAGATGDWAPDLAELAERRAIAHQLGGEESVARHRAQGKLTARERIDGLLDAGSFKEIGVLAGGVKYGANRKRESFTPSNAVVGVGKIDARRTVVASDDYTIRAGSSEGSVSEKWIFADRYAWEYKLPIVRLVDSAGGSVKLLDKMGHTKIPGYPMLPMTQLLGAVPVVGIALGACAGLGALRVASAHLSIMIRGKSQVFAGGPPVVKQALGLDIDKEALGGYDAMHRYSGVVGLAVDTEEEALQATRRFLSYLPSNVWEQPPRMACADPVDRCDEWLNRAIPADKRKIFQPRKILKAIFDEGLAVRDRARFRRLDHHLPGAAERPCGGCDDQQPDDHGRRADARRGAEDGAFRRPVRHLPPAHRQPGRPAGCDDRPGCRT